MLVGAFATCARRGRPDNHDGRQHGGTTQGIWQSRSRVPRGPHHPSSHICSPVFWKKNRWCRGGGPGQTLTRCRKARKWDRDWAKDGTTLENQTMCRVERLSYSPRPNRTTRIRVPWCGTTRLLFLLKPSRLVSLTNRVDSLALQTISGGRGRLLIPNGPVIQG
ncbi:hypothetical protein M433DRAFT_239148 [Acidomyces richmondensis BFW]|nr:hypothetical protein M433DRAFT_239148 [Acidomyces richmondensis BFW]